jgi:hypothetical protein
MIRSFDSAASFRSFVDDCQAITARANVSIERKYCGWGRTRKGWQAFEVMFETRESGTRVLRGHVVCCRVKQ